jgi:hypothetical protein
MFHGLFSVRRDGFDTSLKGRRPLLRAALSAMLLPALCLPPRRVRAGLNLLSNEFTATRDELQAELTRRFPITRRYGELASVTLHNPQLALDGRANRATLASRLVILSPLLQASSLGGQVAVSSGLRWDASGLSVRLQDPRAEQLRIGRHRQRRPKPGAHQRVRRAGSAARLSVAHLPPRRNFASGLRSRASPSVPTRSRCSLSSRQTADDDALGSVRPGR